MKSRKADWDREKGGYEVLGKVGEMGGKGRHTSEQKGGERQCSTAESADCSLWLCGPGLGEWETEAGEQASRSFSANEQGSGQPDTQETWSLKKASMVSGWRQGSAVKNR